MTDPAQAAQALAGTPWRVYSVSGAAPPADVARTSLLIDGDSRLSASVGCNRIAGTAALDGSKVSFGPLAVTRMACPPPLMEIEQRFTTALGAARSFRTGGETIELLDDAGAVLVVLGR